MNRAFKRGLAHCLNSCARGFFRRTSIVAFVAALLSTATNLHAAPQYDGSSNVLPSQSPWHWGYQALNLSNPFTSPQAMATAGSGVTTLDTTPQSADAAGFTTHIANLLSPGFSYVDPDVVPLDRTAGFELDFTVKLLSETHNNNDRAGFSIVALSSDATPLGVELGFWTNEVWAQNAGFTHGESSATFDTTAALVPYRLLIQGTTYSLLANNSQILSGSLRDYTAFNGGPPFNSGFPYNQPNFTFFGDDTSSARASVQIASFNVVPEPSSLILTVEGCALTLALFRLLARGRNTGSTRV